VKKYNHNKRDVKIINGINVVYFGRNLNFAIFQNVDTAEYLCTKTDLGGFHFPGLTQLKGKTQLSVFSSHGSII